MWSVCGVSEGLLAFYNGLTATNQLLLNSSKYGSAPIPYTGRKFLPHRGPNEGRIPNLDDLEYGLYTQYGVVYFDIPMIKSYIINLILKLEYNTKMQEAIKGLGLPTDYWPQVLLSADKYERLSSLV